MAKKKDKKDKKDKKAEKAKKKEEKKKKKEEKKHAKEDKKHAKEGEKVAAAAAVDAASAEKAAEQKEAASKKKKEAGKDEQYVSPFADAPDEGAYGFGEEVSADLADLEHMLNVEVDEDFFAEPRYFHTLHRVINVLGIQLVDDQEDQSGKTVLERNPAYQNLQKQAQVVENAIEHMSRVYCNALNRSVIQVGRVAREFEDAIDKVESMRRRVREIQETIGARSAANQNQQQAKEGEGVEPHTNAGPQGKGGGQSQMSLRELWMKKLESEALLELIEKVNIVRAAPFQFDDHITGFDCRIGTATLCLTKAFDIMFSDDISQVEALSQILESLMVRKSTAEDILWETLQDIIYLRTSNGPVLKFVIPDPKMDQEQQLKKQVLAKSMAEEQGIKRSYSMGAGAASAAFADPQQTNGDPATPQAVNKTIYNPFQKNYSLLCVKHDLETDDISIDSQASGDSVDSDGEDGDEAENKEDGHPGKHARNKSTASMAELELVDDANEGDEDQNKRRAKNMMMPPVVVEADLDLDKDEARCFDSETKSLSKSSIHERYLPRYTDPVLSLRILVECLYRLGRIQKAEDVLMKNVEKEIKAIVQKEQSRTFYRLDRRKGPQSIRTLNKEVDELKEFRRHFTAVLSSFGCIMIRLSHVAQCARTRILADDELSKQMKTPPSKFLSNVIQKAYDVMQTELKDFLRACLQEHLSKGKVVEAPPVEKKNEKKIFSFGVLEGLVDDEGGGKKDGKHKKDSKDENKKDSKDEKKDSKDENKKEAKEDHKKESKDETKPDQPQDTEVDNNEEEDGETVKPEVSVRYSEMPADTFVSTVLFPMTKTTPQVQHALIFRRSVDRFTKINDTRQQELASLTGETITPKRKFERQELAIEFLDKAIQDTVLPSLQQDAVRGTIIASEMQDAFEPPPEANAIGHGNTIVPMDVPMVQACEGMLEKTGPLFMAIHRLPPGGDMYQVLVQVLQFLIETFNSLVEPQVSELCDETTSDELLVGFGKDKGKFSAALGKRKAFMDLLEAYNFDLTLVDDAPSNIQDDGKSHDEYDARQKGHKHPLHHDDFLSEGIEKQEAILRQELEALHEYMDFLPFHQESLDYDLITKGELKKASCLAHSILKVTSILESRLKFRESGRKMLQNTESLHDIIKILKNTGFRLAKFCHVELLLQVIQRMSQVCQSTTLCAPGAVRISSKVNEVSEYLTGTMEYLREGTSDAFAAYMFSNLGQYIPACLTSTARVIAASEGIILRAPLTMNGMESLDRSAAVLYRDLKACTAFLPEFFDIESTALAFEKAATFTSLMEMSIEELAEYYTQNSDEFSDEDFELMFKMDGPRRRGDDKQFKRLKKEIKKRKKEKEEKARLEGEKKEQG